MWGFIVPFNPINTHHHHPLLLILSNPCFLHLFHTFFTLLLLPFLTLVSVPNLFSFLFSFVYIIFHFLTRYYYHLIPSFIMLSMEEILCELSREDMNNEKGLPPGFRFHPTDEELITFYLASKVFNGTFCGIQIAEVDLNRCEPWELPGNTHTHTHSLH